MKGSFGTPWWKSTFNWSGHRRITAIPLRDENALTADEGSVRRQVLSGWLPGRRFYPVYAFSLKLLLCLICHNGKGKAGAVIIMIEFA